MCWIDLGCPVCHGTLSAMVLYLPWYLTHRGLLPAMDPLPSMDTTFLGKPTCHGHSCRRTLQARGQQLDWSVTVGTVLWCHIGKTHFIFSQILTFVLLLDKGPLFQKKSYKKNLKLLFPHCVFQVPSQHGQCFAYSKVSLKKHSMQLYLAILFWTNSMMLL